MKKISKTKFDAQKTIGFVKSEKTILSEMNSPFILKLKSSFQTNKCFYMITQFAAGGDLAQYLKIYKVFPEDTVKVLCAEIIVALEYLHAHHVVYGDLKPENILLDIEGHVLLADFGLSWIQNETQNFQSTDEFMSPEQILGNKLNKSIDFWALVYSKGNHDLYDACWPITIFFKKSDAFVSANSSS